MSNQQIINADFIKDNPLDSDSVDLILTSPPYNLNIKYDIHDDSMSEEAYNDFTEGWLAQCHRILKDDGRMCINIPIDTAMDMDSSLSYKIEHAARKLGLKRHRFTIVWYDNHMSKNTAWGSFASASSPFIITPCEIIMVFYKKQWKKLTKGVDTISKKDFMEWANGVWKFRGESATNIGHPAPFPIELPRRCIEMFTFQGDTVVDPFLGSGTTLVACKMYGRKGIGFDISPDYCDLARKRLEKAAYLQQPLIPEPDLTDKEVEEWVQKQKAQQLPLSLP